MTAQISHKTSPWDSYCECLPRSYLFHPTPFETYVLTATRTGHAQCNWPGINSSSMHTQPKRSPMTSKHTHYTKRKPSMKRLWPSRQNESSSSTLRLLPTACQADRTIRPIIENLDVPQMTTGHWIRNTLDAKHASGPSIAHVPAETPGQCRLQNVRDSEF